MLIVLGDYLWRLIEPSSPGKHGKPPSICPNWVSSAFTNWVERKKVVPKIPKFGTPYFGEKIANFLNLGSKGPWPKIWPQGPNPFKNIAGVQVSP